MFRDTRIDYREKASIRATSVGGWGVEAYNKDRTIVSPGNAEKPRGFHVQNNETIAEAVAKVESVIGKTLRWL